MSDETVNMGKLQQAAFILMCPPRKVSVVPAGQTLTKR